MDFGTINLLLVIGLCVYGLYNLHCWIEKEF